MQRAWGRADDADYISGSNLGEGGRGGGGLDFEPRRREADMRPIYLSMLHTS